MSDLTQFRDHCKRMGGPVTQRTIHLTDDERALFRALAREVEHYLAKPDAALTPTDEDQPLDFEEQP